MNTNQKHADTCFLTNIESNKQRFKKQTLKQIHAHSRALTYIDIEESDVYKYIRIKNTRTPPFLQTSAQTIHPLKEALQTKG